MASAAGAAALGLARRPPWAVLAGITAGSVLEMAINVFSLAAGPFLMARFWRRRHRLEAGASRA